MSSRGVPNAKKITEERGYLPEPVFNEDKSTLFWGKKNHKGYLLVRNGSENQNLRQEQIGSPYCFVLMYSDLLPIKLLIPKI